LVNKACDYFDNVYGIEPSLAAIQIAKEITKDKKNITFINDGMIEGIKKVNIHNAPFLITTSAVLSHIDNIHVSYFLQQLNSLASIGSKFYFYEPYDKNIDVNLWHVRSKSWWIDRLPNWRIKFLDLPDCGYKKGIEGEFLGINCQALNNSLYSSSFASNLLWNVSGHWYKLRYAISRFVK
jgi:hypothetical protein